MKKRFLQFFDEGDEGGASPAAALLDTPTLDKPEGNVEPEPKLEPKAAFDYKALAAANAEAFKAAGFAPAAPKVEPQKQLTPEEAKKLLNVWEPDDAFLQEFGNLETQKAAIAKMRDNFIRQADTVAQLRMQEMQQQLEVRYAPLQNYVTEQEAVARETRFNTQFPDLAKPELRPLLTSIVQGLAAQGALDPKDETKTFKTIATAVEAVIKQTNPNFKLSPASAGGKPNNNGNALRATTSGSGGGGGGKAPASDKPLGVRLLGR